MYFFDARGLTGKHWLVAIEDLVAGLAGDPNLACKFPLSASRRRKLQLFVHYRTLPPRHPFLPSGRKYHLCGRDNLLANGLLNNNAYN
jgi:hypothetical protein